MEACLQERVVAFLIRGPKDAMPGKLPENIRENEAEGLEVGSIVERKRKMLEERRVEAVPAELGRLHKRFFKIGRKELFIGSDQSGKPEVDHGHERLRDRVCLLLALDDEVLGLQVEMENASRVDLLDRVDGCDDDFGLAFFRAVEKGRSQRVPFHDRNEKRLLRLWKV